MTTLGQVCGRSAFVAGVIVAFAVFDQVLVIVGIFYGGRDYAAILAGPEE